MLAGGYLRDDPAVAGVDVYLGGHHIAQDIPSIGHHSYRCLIAGGIYT